MNNNWKEGNSLLLYYIDYQYIFMTKTLGNTFVNIYQPNNFKNNALEILIKN